MQESSHPQLWDSLWTESDKTQSSASFHSWVERETSGVRGVKIQNYIKERFKSLKGLKIIEVGSGPGIYSFIFACAGAEVTLLDYSEKALKLAEKQFRAKGMTARFLLQNAFEIPSAMKGKYDVAMSFGTVEHYRYPQRLDIIKSHLECVGPGGIIAISAPNRYFFPHEILKFYLQKTNKWKLGYEGAFTRNEWIRITKQLNVNKTRIIGSAFVTDFYRYIDIYLSTSIAKKIFGDRKTKEFYQDHKSCLDDLFGADLTLLGEKAKGPGGQVLHG